MRRRSVLGAIALLTVLLTTSGCGLAGFSEALAHPQAQQPADATPTAAAPSTPPDQPHVIAEAALLSDGVPVGTVRVTAGQLETGYVPPIEGFSQQCPVSGPALQYVPVEMRFDLTDSRGDGGPAGHLSVAAGPATPADVGDLGVFFRQDPDVDEPYCADYPPLPTTDTFWARGTTEVTGYVVLDQAVGAATPEGRADVFPTLQLRLDDLRVHSYAGRDTELTLGPLTAGAACPDDADALCVAVG